MMTFYGILAHPQRHNLDATPKYAIHEISRLLDRSEEQVSPHLASSIMLLGVVQKAQLYAWQSATVLCIEAPAMKYASVASPSRRNGRMS